MDEETIEQELEERLYATLYYGDETQKEGTNHQKTPEFTNLPQSTLRRYWHTTEKNTTYKKINTCSNNINTPTNKVSTPKDENKKETDNSKHKPKEVESAPTTRTDLSILQQTVPVNIRKTIEIIETEVKTCIVELESSDEDEVIEVALPPKPTITIESSDDEDEIGISQIPIEGETKTLASKPSNDQATRSSPVPSVVSSVSDDFIRSDCIALKISSKHPNNQSFDFSIQGSDNESTPSKKKKKKKSKDATSTPSSKTVKNMEEYFATPKTKAKNKKQITKSYQVSNISIPNVDVYDSDSNQSLADINNKSGSYKVTDRSLPHTDVYETDSNNSENVKDNSPTKSSDIIISDAESSGHHSEEEVTANNTPIENLTDLPDMNSTIEENIVMANVTGLTVKDNVDDNVTLTSSPLKCGSTKIPAILNEDLDFDNLKGNKVCKRRQYSLTALRAEMEKFYNDSWGGEDFNHREIQKNMSRDKSLWAIDAKDRMPVLAKRKVTCNYCNKVGHRDDTCRLKPPICFMCGLAGHYEPRCPKKICVNCGTPNHVYTTMCQSCSNWHSIRCAECGQFGHPPSHCPDIWRRYHNTTSLDVPLDENRQMKKHYQMFCSGCARRGHLIHTCRVTLPYSGLPIYSPYVSLYRPTYSPSINKNIAQSTELLNHSNKHHKKNNQDTILATPKSVCNKRQSKSPIADDISNKKRNLGTNDDPKVNSNNNVQRKHTQSKDNNDSNVDTNKTLNKKGTQCESTPECITVSSSNHDNKGQIIQDSEISDTSEVITSARIYITKEIKDMLKTKDGDDWLKQLSIKNNVTLENTDINFFLSIKGSIGSQEAFQSELRDWIKSKETTKEPRISENDANESMEENNQLIDSSNIPKNRNNVLRIINTALNSLKSNIGDPKVLYKELCYLRDRQQKLLTQNIVSPKQLTNNRNNIKKMLKKLNMVLIGQAGLANGNKHLSELYLLQEKLTNFRQKTIPLSLRQEIGHHFHCIFTTIQRDDYEELLRKYYNKTPTKSLGKNKSKKQLKLSPNVMENSNLNEIKLKDKQDNTLILPPFKISNYEKLRNKLIFFQSRLMRVKPTDAKLKKLRGKIMRDIHLNIASLGSSGLHISLSLFKNIKKVEAQAKQFFTKIEFNHK